MSLSFASASELARLLREKEIGSRELTDHFIGRIEKHDGGINAVVVRDFERARKAADEADAALSRGELRGPLHGIPMTIKEAYDLAGTATTWGVPPFAGNIATQDSESVRRYKQAGAHFLGKTNVPLQLADLQSYNEIYGTTRNPWNPERGPGGSSGGSAAALAAGMTALESGSDIAGSIRNPAHFCGVYGHKPTWGVVPDQGHALPGMFSSPDLAVVGPMARSAEDLALALDVVAGADPLHAPGWTLALPRPSRAALSEYKVALWANDEVAPVATEVADRVQELGDRLAALGATVSDLARPALEPAAAFENYLALLNGQMCAGIPDEAFAQLVAATDSLARDDRSTTAVNLRATTQRHRDWGRAHNERGRLRRVWRSFFDDWDILLCPITATPAFPHDHSPTGQRSLDVDGNPQPYFQQIFWAGLATNTFLPSTVFPTGPSSEGLPIGLQAIGAEFQDLACIDFARLIGQEFGGFAPPPGFED